MDGQVGLLLQHLSQLTVNHLNLITGAEREIELLVHDLSSLKAMLEGKGLGAMDREIREVLYDIEDTIDACITQMASSRKLSQLNRLFKSSSITLAEEVRNIRTRRVRPLLDRTSFSSLTIADVSHKVMEEAEITTRLRTQKLDTRHIVGLEEETNELVKFLCGDSERPEIASIVGMAGLGKTTLAWKIFERAEIKFEFPVRIWVNITDSLNMRNVLLTILKEISANVQEESEQEMITKVREQLRHGRFLIVMDDIWTLEDWNRVRKILPMENKYGRVLVTTRNMGVGKMSSTRQPHHLRFLCPNESWELLQYQVFKQLGVVAPDIVGIGKVIATLCDGLPLSVKVIGGILEDKISTAAGHTSWMKKELIEVSQSVRKYLVAGDKNNLLSRIIRLSYEKLPYELRTCFLYLGVFPEDADIPIKKLIRLWIAEGFIQKHEEQSLEVTALAHLKELINRNLVMVRKVTIGGEPKTCHMHDSVREICKMEAGFSNLNLFQEINKSPRGDFEPLNDIDKCRRLCIHSYVLDFLSRKLVTPKARSFLCFHESAMILRPTDVISFTKGFGLLRVYDAVNIKFPKIPIILVQILHLRYLTLVVDQCKSLPEFIDELVNLQTLIVNVSSTTLDMKSDIWKMRQLRHLETKASIKLMKGARGEGGEYLQTLSRLSPESCTGHFAERAKNLITLSIQGDLNILPEPRCLEKLTNLNKLKLVHGIAHGVASENPLRCLPDPHNFPPNLKILVLRNTYLDWNKMQTLSYHTSLEVLKLKENAFKGARWEAIGGGFHHLKTLQIERITELVYWTASGDSFPKLKVLILNNCDKLLEVPDILYNNLELMSIERVTYVLVSSAEAKWEKKTKEGKTFKLEIAPGDKIRRS